MTNLEQPIPIDEPMPHRKVIREWLVPLSDRVTFGAIALLLMDYAIWAGFLAGTVFFEAWWAKLLCAVAMGFTIGRLFIIGHDACHQSLTPHRGLNKWLGRIAFLPSLTTYSLWDIGHNVVHHGYTNLKGFDFVWAPLTQEEFAKLSWMGRLLDRIYRSGWAPGLY
jgi:omega-6 fatty acid desaturase (delta-12 desaturase)